MLGAVQVELGGRIGEPALAERLPVAHVDGALSEHRPHGHLIGARVRRRHDDEAKGGRGWGGGAREYAGDAGTMYCGGKRVEEVRGRGGENSLETKRMG